MTKKREDRVPSYLPFLLILLVGLTSLQVAYVAPSSSRGAEVTNETTTTTDTSYGTTWTSTPPVHVTSSLPLHPSDQALAVGSGKALNRTRGTPVSGFWNATHGTGALPTVVQAASKAGVSVAGALPGMFSWNGFTGGTNWMTPIENQGNCGSCWAFAPVGAMEAQYQIQIGNSNTGIDLSEQNLLSCTPPKPGDPTSYGCVGNYLDQALNFLQNSGTPDAACNPYTAIDPQHGSTCGTGRCSDYLSRTWKTTGWSWISTDTANIKNYLYTQGPVIVWMPVYSDFPWWDASYWQTYYYSHSTSGSYTGHFVNTFANGNTGQQLTHHPFSPAR